MSSNVGTLTFKAPEFWDKKPNDRVTYHRNVDVYAAGLTFEAILQIISGTQSLVPKVEGSMQHSETLMPIGLAAYSRMVNRHPDINIVETRKTESQLVVKIKQVIREMTHVSPIQRLSSPRVESKLHELVSNVKFRSNFKENCSFKIYTGKSFMRNCLLTNFLTFGDVYYYFQIVYVFHPL